MNPGHPQGLKQRMPRAATSPWTNPAIAVELTERERRALMSQEDWGDEIDRYLARPMLIDGRWVAP